MGKKIIIKGANFSVNGISSEDWEPVNLLSLMSITVGYAIGVSNKKPPYYAKNPPMDVEDNNKRASSHVVNISRFVRDHTTVTLTPKNGYKFAIYISSADGDANLVDWSYYTSAATFSVVGMTVCQIMVARVQDGDDLTSNDINDYITETNE